MSKVGNLRAMFETGNKWDDPERGRSPAGGLSAGSESPRPLSRIRSNFIAVEKDGRIGLQRDPSSDSVLSVTKKPSDDIREAGTSAPSQSSDSPPSFADRLQKQNKSGLSMETIPQSPQTPQDDAATASKSQGPSPAQATGPAAGKTEAAPAANKIASSVRAEGSASAAKSTKPSQGQNLNAKTAVERDKPKTTAQTTAKDAPSKDSAKTASKLPSIITTKATAKVSAKSPTVAKTPTSPTKGIKLPSKTPEKKALEPQKIATPRSTTKANTKTTTTAGASAATKKPPTVQISHSNNLDRGVGFVKPKVKSPTRPVTLPPGLTTHTAASATRTNKGRQSVSQQSGTYRSPSRASVSTAGGTLRRQSSTIGRPRPSLGPPPKQLAADHPVTKREKQVDEGFLARMMRPTQASSSKTHEKVATTPPRKVSAPTTVAKRPAAAKETVVGTAKKTVSKTEDVAKKVVPKANKSEEKSAPKKDVILPVIQKSETASKPATENKVKPEARDAPKTPEPHFEAEVATEQAPVKHSPTGPMQVEESAEEVASDTEEQKETAPEIAEARDPVTPEPKVSEPEDMSVTPVAEVPAVDGSVEETNSEAEPVEPETPTEAVDADGKAALVDAGVESKSAEEVKAADVLGLEKREEDATLA